MIPLLVVILLLVTFRPWFFVPGTLSAGDWPYLYIEHIRSFLWTPEPRFLWLSPYYQILSKIAIELGLSWHFVERMFWFWPWIGLSIYSSFVLTRSWVGALIYTTNTYALMLVGGGQMGVAMAYALAPLVLTRPMVFPIQAMFDPRIALLTLLVSLRKNPKQLIVPLIITAVFHAYWWIPFIKNPSILSTQFQGATSEAVKYLSFASFSNAISLLHPNWPENIFGKVYFMRPEFLGIPILAFGAMLLKKLHPKIIFFAFLALIGAFLAKGSSEPLGGLYLWLFDHVPGFSLFRDATKFYLYVALAYAVLIPYVLEKLNKKLFVILFLVLWGFTIREAIAGNLTGTFKPIEVPAEYVKFKESDVAWYPKKSRFSVSGSDFQTLKNIRYVVVPADVRGEIFVTDRMYDESKHQEAIALVATMSGLRRVDEYKDLAVFEVMQ